MPDPRKKNSTSRTIIFNDLVMEHHWRKMIGRAVDEPLHRLHTANEVSELNATAAPLNSLLLVESLDESGFIQFRDKARVDKLFRFVCADLRPCLSDIIVSRFQPFGDRIGCGDEILLEHIIGTFQKLRIRGSYVLRQNFQTEFFILFMKGDGFDM